jgi:glucose-6-phosphate 1-dehydrogenase
MQRDDLQPTILVVFGISGDLSHRYLLPALSQIKKASQLPKDFRLLGVSRRQIDIEEALGRSKSSLAKITHLFQMDMGKQTEYKKLKDKLNEFGPKHQIIFYLAIPPDGVPGIIHKLGTAGLNTSRIKLLLEKPFGTDLVSSKELVHESRKHFKEKQTYRIDHYLAKEVSQNIAIFLGSNVLFKRVWNNQFIEFIEITAAEKIAVGGRANFYEQTGALRDVVQSHLLQLAALTLMEPCPPEFDFGGLPRRRLSALRKLYVAKNQLKSIVAAQYYGYRNEVGNPSSKTETFVALQLASKDPRWKDVPIYLASGKNLNKKLTQIRISFKKDSDSEANNLILRIQPRESIELDLWVKEPGYTRRLQKTTHSFSYQYHFKNRLPDAYEQILVDAIAANQSLFASSDEVVASWRILQPILDYWEAGNKKLKFYEPGSSLEQVLYNR